MQAGTESNSNDHITTSSNGNGSVSFAELLDQYTFRRPQRGEVVKGRILKVENDVLFIDIGSKRDAIVSTRDLSDLDESFVENISPGDQVPVYIIQTPDEGDTLLVSLKKGLEQQEWERAESLVGTDELLELKVIGYNKGGLLVEFGPIRGFVPNSHVPDLQHIQNRDQLVSQKAKKIGATMLVKVIEVDRERERLVLSAAAAQQQSRLQQLEELQEGQVLKGRVDHITDYGAFIDLGSGLNGLLHVSRIAWEHVDHPADVLEVGQEIEVMVESVNAERERVALNRQALLPSPWQLLAERHAVGDLVEGIVTAVLDFGAFVKLPSGIEGLIHVSEMDIPSSGSPQAVLQTGDTVLTRIVNMEPEEERLGLSLRRVKTTEQIEWMAQRPTGEIEESPEPEEVEEPDLVPEPG